MWYLFISLIMTIQYSQYLCRNDFKKGNVLKMSSSEITKCYLLGLLHYNGEYWKVDISRTKAWIRSFNLYSTHCKHVKYVFSTSWMSWLRCKGNWLFNLLSIKVGWNHGRSILKDWFSLFCKMILCNYFTICFKHQCN